MKKALILFSGGLDSRVTSKFMEELGFQIHLLFVKLPFGAGCGHFEGIEKFAEENNFKLHIVDATKGKLLREYLNLIKKPKFGYGSGINPCKDCKIFIFKQSKEIREKINADIICSGEVMGQRPMSQMKKTLLLDEKESGLSGQILRPLSAQLLPPTEYENMGIIDRTKLLDIEGRQREKQMKLASKYKIEYPTPAGGCLLCEKNCAKKIKFFLDYKDEISMEELSLIKFGRMFKNKGLIFVGRSELENKILDNISKKINWNLFLNTKIPGPTIIFEKKEDENLVKDIWDAYSKKNLELIKKFSNYKID